MFSGQPLIILGSTGPLYVFEKILYSICKDHDWDYLGLRMWVGLWVGAILFVIVAMDASAYICYVTRLVNHYLGMQRKSNIMTYSTYTHRYTQELFAFLIAFIFITNALENMFDIVETHQFAPNSLQIECTCLVDNSTLNWVVTKAQCAENGGFLVSAQTCLDHAVLKSFKDRWKLLYVL